MPKDIHQRDTAQQRSSRLLLAMGIIVLLGALAYFVLTLVVNRRAPASPDTRCTAENGISVYYESAVWPVCEMTEDATLGRALELASAESSDDVLATIEYDSGDVIYVSGLTKLASISDIVNLVESVSLS